MNRFEQLIEYVINDEEQKARELFHDIVVEKSRQIYENLMQEEAEEDLDEAAEEDLDEAAEEELDEADMGDNNLIDEVEVEEESDMHMEGEDDEMDDEMGGDAQDEFVSDVEVSKTDFDDEGGDEPATKDDIMNLEDKLDQLMAEFEAELAGDAGGTDGDMMGSDEGGDAIEMDDTEEMMPMAEAISLKAAPKPVTTEQGDGKAGPVAFNSGATGMAAKPVHTGTSMGGSHDTNAYRNTTKDLIGKVGNSPAQSTQGLKPATKPHLGQASGVNNKSPLPSGRKG
jgi:hypothetical protein